MTTEEQIEALTQRVLQAKRQNWIAIAVCLTAVMICFAVLAVTGRTSAESPDLGADNIYANAFVLRDSAGVERAGLYVTEEGCELRLGNKAGLMPLALKVDDIGPGLKMNGESGNICVSLYVVDGDPWLSLFGDYPVGGKPSGSAILGVGSGSPQFALFDINQKIRAGLSVGEDGPVLNLFNEIGRAIWGGANAIDHKDLAQMLPIPLFQFCGKSYRTSLHGLSLRLRRISPPLPLLIAARQVQEQCLSKESLSFLQGMPKFEEFSGRKNTSIR